MRIVTLLSARPRGPGCYHHKQPWPELSTPQGGAPTATWPLAWAILRQLQCVSPSGLVGVVAITIWLPFAAETFGFLLHPQYAPRPGRDAPAACMRPCPPVEGPPMLYTDVGTSEAFWPANNSAWNFTAPARCPGLSPASSRRRRAPQATRRGSPGVSLSSTQVPRAAYPIEAAPPAIVGRN